MVEVGGEVLLGEVLLVDLDELAGLVVVTLGMLLACQRHQGLLQRHSELLAADGVDIDVAVEIAPFQLLAVDTVDEVVGAGVGETLLLRIGDHLVVQAVLDGVGADHREDVGNAARIGVTEVDVAHELVSTDDIEQHELVAVEGTGFDIDFPADFGIDLVGNLGGDDAGLHQSGDVERNLEALGGDVVELLAAALVGEGETLGVVAHHGEHIGDFEEIGGAVHDDCLVVTEAVELLGQGEGQRFALIELVVELLDIPVHAGEGVVEDAHIGACALDLLGVPEGEGVVVAEGDKDAVLLDALEVVLGEVAGGGLLATVVVVPVLGSHEAGNTGHAEDEDHGEHHLVDFLLILFK